jgi:hypothetical protein
MNYFEIINANYSMWCKLHTISSFDRLEYKQWKVVAF